MRRSVDDEPSVDTTGECNNAAVSQRMASPELVGRDDELAVLRESFERACAGRPAVVVISGDAGIGKTRLVNEFRDHTVESTSLVVTGSCVPIEGGGLPYAAVVGILRRLSHDLGEPTLAGPLTMLVPRLRSDADPDGVAASTPQDRGGLVDALTKTRVFEAVLDHVTTCCRPDPAHPGHRRPPLGRLLHHGAPRVPDPEPDRGTCAGPRHLPRRRVGEGSSDSALARRARSTRAGPAASPRRPGPGGDRTADRGHPRPGAGVGARRRGLGEIAGQPVLRGGAHRGAPQPNIVGRAPRRGHGPCPRPHSRGATPARGGRRERITGRPSTLRGRQRSGCGGAGPGVQRGDRPADPRDGRRLGKMSLPPCVARRSRRGGRDARRAGAPPSRPGYGAGREPIARFLRCRSTIGRARRSLVGRGRMDRCMPRIDLVRARGGVGLGLPGSARPSRTGAVGPGSHGIRRAGGPAPADRGGGEHRVPRRRGPAIRRAGPPGADARRRSDRAHPCRRASPRCSGGTCGASATPAPPSTPTGTRSICCPRTRRASSWRSPSPRTGEGS